MKIGSVCSKGRPAAPFLTTLEGVISGGPSSLGPRLARAKPLSRSAPLGSPHGHPPCPAEPHSAPPNAFRTHHCARSIGRAPAAYDRQSRLHSSRESPLSWSPDDKSFGPVEPPKCPALPHRPPPQLGFAAFLQQQM